MEHVLVMHIAVTPQEDGGTTAVITSTSTTTMMDRVDLCILTPWAFKPCFVEMKIRPSFISDSWLTPNGLAIAFTLLNKHVRSIAIYCN